MRSLSTFNTCRTDSDPPQAAPRSGALGLGLARPPSTATRLVVHDPDSASASAAPAAPPHPPFCSYSYYYEGQPASLSSSSLLYPVTWLRHKWSDYHHKQAVRRTVEAHALDISRPMPPPPNIVSVAQDVPMEGVEDEDSGPHVLPTGFTIDHRVKNADGTVDENADFVTITYHLESLSSARLKEICKDLNLPHSYSKKPLIKQLKQHSKKGQVGWKEFYAKPRTRSHRGPTSDKPRRETLSARRQRAKQLETGPGLRPDDRLIDDLESLQNAVNYGIALAMTDPNSDDEAESARPESGLIDPSMGTSSLGSSLDSVAQAAGAPTPPPSVASSLSPPDIDNIVSLMRALGIHGSSLGHIRDEIVAEATAAFRSPLASVRMSSEDLHVRDSPALSPRLLSASLHGSSRSVSASIESVPSNVYSTAATGGGSSIRSSSCSVMSTSSANSESTSSLVSSARSARESASSDKTRSIFAFGEVRTFKLSSLPVKIPALYFADDIATLNDVWGPEDLFRGYTLRRIGWTLNGLELPLNRWREVFRGHPGYRQLKGRLDEFELVVDEYRRFATPAEFWAVRGGYTNALVHSRQQRAAAAAILAHRVIHSQGSDLGASNDHNIAKRYLRRAKENDLPRAVDAQLLMDIKAFYKLA
ncbi:hypothetical protein EV121DRAFT_295660 [Schizophyllum commune]